MHAAFATCGGDARQMHAAFATCGGDTRQMHAAFATCGGDTRQMRCIGGGRAWPGCFFYRMVLPPAHLPPPHENHHLGLRGTWDNPNARWGDSASLLDADGSFSMSHSTSRALQVVAVKRAQGADALVERAAAAALGLLDMVEESEHLLLGEQGGAGRAVMPGDARDPGEAALQRAGAQGLELRKTGEGGGGIGYALHRAAKLRLSRFAFPLCQVRDGPDEEAKGRVT